MGSEDVMMGELIAGLRANTDAVKELAVAMKEVTQSQSEHATQLAEIRKDLQNQSEEVKEIRTSINSNEHSKQLLVSLGLTPDKPEETRGYFEFIRVRQEEVANSKRNIGYFKTAMATILIATICGFLLNIMIDGFAAKTPAQVIVTAKQAVSNSTNESMLNGQGGGDDSNK